MRRCVCASFQGRKLKTLGEDACNRNVTGRGIISSSSIDPPVKQHICVKTHKYNKIDLKVFEMVLNDSKWLEIFV